MEFVIKVRNGNRNYLLKVQLIQQTDHSEQFKLSAFNNPEKYIIAETNRKLFQRKGLKHRKGTWTVIQGIVMNKSSLESTFMAIDRHINNR